MRKVGQRVKADRAQNGDKDGYKPGVVIMPTKEGWEGKLYETVLAELEGDKPQTLSETNADAVQKLIKAVKHGDKLVPGENKTPVAFFQELINKFKSEHEGASTFILGCTELSVVAAPVMEEMTNAGFVLYDSQQIFADTIVADLICPD